MIPTAIVVPLDGSRMAEHAIPVATALATQLDAGLVFARTTYGDCRFASDYLDSLAKATGRTDVERIVLPDETAAHAVVQIVESHPGSMICMTTHGRGRLRWAAAGSVAEDIIKDTTEPLMLIGPHAGTEWPTAPRRIIICADGTALDQAATEVACEWAKALGLEVHAVCVFHPLDLEADHPEVVFEPLEEIVHAAGLQLRTHQLFQSSFVGGAIVDFAKEMDATFLVMGGHHHGVIARLALGSTSMATVHMAPCPVLVVPPDDPGEVKT